MKLSALCIHLVCMCIQQPVRSNGVGVASLANGLSFEWTVRIFRKAPSGYGVQDRWAGAGSVL